MVGWRPAVPYSGSWRLLRPVVIALGGVEQFLVRLRRRYAVLAMAAAASGVERDLGERLRTVLAELPDLEGVDGEQMRVEVSKASDRLSAGAEA
jgi:hypothetical protein